MEKKFKVEVSEKYRKGLIIEACDKEDAQEKAGEMDIVMHPDNYSDNSFTIEETTELSEEEVNELESDEKNRFFSGFVIAESGRFILQFGHWNIEQIKKEILAEEGDDLENEYFIHETLGLPSAIKL